MSAALRQPPIAAGLKGLDVRWRPAHAENPGKHKKPHALGSGGTENDFGIAGM
jgi:hypothetical protein